MAFIKRVKLAEPRVQMVTSPMTKFDPDKVARLFDKPEEGFLDWEPDQWADHYRVGAQLHRDKG
jgi:hypothetical protein